MSTYGERVANTRLRRVLRVRKTVILRSHDRFHVRVFRSGRYIYADLYDVEVGRVLTGLSSRSVVGVAGQPGGCTASHELGVAMARLVAARGIARVTFDRGGYKYHGRVASVACGLRQGGCLL